MSRHRPKSAKRTQPLPFEVWRDTPVARVIELECDPDEVPDRLAQEYADYQANFKPMLIPTRGRALPTS